MLYLHPLRAYPRSGMLILALFLPVLLWVSGCGEEMPTTSKGSIRVTDVTISVTGGNALIQWRTDVPADSQVMYGLADSYGMSIRGDALATEHTVELVDLELESLYHFRVQVTNESGAEGASRDFTFMTLAAGETTPQAFQVDAKVDTGSVSILWQTNESVTSEIEYGEDASYGSRLPGGQTELTHRVQLTGLAPDMTYHYHIRLTDLDGNEFVSPDFTFQTGPVSTPVDDAPVRMNVTARQWQFTPNTIRVNKGDKVVLTLRSVDVAHGFGLAAFNVNEAINPGQDIVVEFTAKKKGQHTFICTVNCGAGHANMKGTLIVE